MTARRGERYTDDEIARIRRMAGERRTDREIAAALGGTSKNQVGIVRRANGIPSGQCRRYTHAEDAAIREAVAAGRSSKEIAEEIGRTKRSIDNRRIDELVDSPHRGPQQIAAEARREAHIQLLRERREARRAAEREGAEG